MLQVYLQNTYLLILSFWYNVFWWGWLICKILLDSSWWVFIFEWANPNYFIGWQLPFHIQKESFCLENFLLKNPNLQWEVFWISTNWNPKWGYQVQNCCSLENKFKLYTEMNLLLLRSFCFVIMCRRFLKNCRVSCALYNM
jgi:hypothetical protein